MSDAPVDIHWGSAPSCIGHVLVALREGGICAVMLGEDDDALQRELAARFPGASLLREGSEAAAAAAAVAAVVDAPGPAPQLPLDLRGTTFQRLVWDTLRRVPVGETVSYSELAARIGRPRAVRAAAAACAANPIAVLIPCHRVIGRNGALTGYRWGVERKRELLRREAGSARPEDGGA